MNKNKEYVSPNRTVLYPKRVATYLRGDYEEVKPITAEIHPSNACNMSCSYCMYADRQDGKELSLEEMKTAFDKLIEMGVEGVNISGGGEPLMQKKVLDAIEYGRPDLSFGFITNGSLIDEETARRLVKHCKWIRVSLDTILPEHYREQRGYPLGPVREGLRNLVEAKKEAGADTTIGVQTVVTDEVLPDIRTTARYCDSLGVSYYKVRPLEDIMQVTEEQKRTTLTLVEHLRQELDIPVLSTRYKWEVAGIESNEFSHCPAILFQLSVGAHGKVHACCHKTTRERYQYGNILIDAPELLMRRRVDLYEKVRPSEECVPACRGTLCNMAIRKVTNRREADKFI